MRRRGAGRRTAASNARGRDARLPARGVLRKALPNPTAPAVGLEIRGEPMAIVAESCRGAANAAVLAGGPNEIDRAARTVDTSPSSPTTPIPMTRFPFFRRALPAIALGLLVAAAASAQPAQRSLSDRLARAIPDLTDAQRSQLNALTLPSHDDRQPGALWTVAASATDILTPAQIETLLSAREQMRNDRGRRTGRGGEGRMGRRHRGGRMRGGRARAGNRSQLTDEQREAMHETRDAMRSEREALVEQFRSGAIDAATFQSRSEALRDRHREAHRASATSEQLERMDAAQERRDAAKAARESTLGLTQAQKDELEAIRLERIRMAPGRPDLRPYLDADGQLDRQALREARRAQREATSDEREALQERAASVLTNEQKAITAVHRMLSRGRRAGRAGDGRREVRGEGRRGRR